MKNESFYSKAQICQAKQAKELYQLKQPNWHRESNLKHHIQQQDDEYLTTSKHVRIQSGSISKLVDYINPTWKG